MMNDRIRELAKAYLVHERYTRYGEIVEEDLYEFYPDELEKFAELIVQDCVRIARNKSEFITQQARLYADDDDEEVWARATAWQFKVFEQEVKRHFGVEE